MTTITTNLRCICFVVLSYCFGAFSSSAQPYPPGTVTSSEAGILSPYGEFFPTMPGPAALVTMPDIDTGQRGTGIVWVVKIQMDVNHDNIMNLTFGGPDNTSQARPFVFWINNDRDLPDGGAGHDVSILPLPYRTPGVPVADCDFGNLGCQRNLEDFARLWLCGLPKLPPSQGYSATLSMVAVSGYPTINLYPSYDPTGSASYLFDTNAAAAQFTQLFLGNQLMFDYAKRLAQITPDRSYSLPLSSDGTPQFTRFLFEGAGTNSSGQLILTISQTSGGTTNIVGQTSAWLELHDVKDLYERAVISNSYAGPINNWSSGVERIEYPTASIDDNPDIIVFVHGINNTIPDWLTTSDTMFKRLYWAGYRGKFATVRWDCLYLLPNTIDPFQFNRSELRAYKAATGFKAYLASLRSRFPGCRIHVVAHSQGNGVASEAISQGASADTYILTQAAMPASGYDVNAPINVDLVNADTPPAGEPTPEWRVMGYHGIYTNFTGRIASLFNPQDYALGWWLSDQKLSKPDGIPGARNYTSDGTNGYAIIDLGVYRLVTDSEECRAMVSRARTLAIGAQGPVTGQITQGVIGTSFDLHAQFGFFDSRDEHSAEFTRPMQTCYRYYQELMSLIQP